MGHLDNALSCGDALVWLNGQHEPKVMNVWRESRHYLNRFVLFRNERYNLRYDEKLNMEVGQKATY